MKGMHQEINLDGKTALQLAHDTRSWYWFELCF